MTFETWIAFAATSAALVLVQGPTTLRLAFLLTFASASIAAAQSSALDAPPVGIAACDEFLAAYEACIRTKVPEAARPAMLQSVIQSRASWREALARTEVARRTVTAQCQQSREIIGKRLEAAHGCRF